MAKFIKLPDDRVWINIDMIVTMYYLPEDDKTYIFSADDPNEHIIVKGDITSSILNANNELSMHDKNLGNIMVNKFKSMFSTIIARLDSIEKKVSCR